MPVIGIRELREKTAEVLREVREHRAEYVITYQGRPIAFLSPVDSEAVEEAMVEAGRQSAGAEWDDYRRIIEEIRDQWPESVTTQDAIDDIRR